MNCSICKRPVVGDKGKHYQEYNELALFGLFYIFCYRCINRKKYVQFLKPIFEKLNLEFKGGEIEWKT